MTEQSAILQDSAAGAKGSGGASNFDRYIFAMLIALIAGCIGGTVTALLTTKLKIHHDGVYPDSGCRLYIGSSAGGGRRNGFRLMQHVQGVCDIRHGVGYGVFAVFKRCAREESAAQRRHENAVRAADGSAVFVGEENQT